MILPNIIKDRTLLVLFALSFAVWGFTFIYAFSWLGAIKTPLLVHFDTYKGVADFIGSRWDVFGILFSSFAMILVNLLLSNFLYYRERFLSYLFAFASLALSILILIVTGVIVSVN